MCVFYLIFVCVCVCVFRTFKRCRWNSRLRRRCIIHLGRRADVFANRRRLKRRRGDGKAAVVAPHGWESFSSEAPAAHQKLIAQTN